MGASPSWKVYNNNGEYVASFKDIYDAAQFVSLEEGREIRYGHSKRQTVWVQSYPDSDAGESFDAVAEEAARRLPELFG